jgi:hypothetical protein
MKFKEGQMVILRANKREGWPEEYGVFGGYEGINGMCIVRVTPRGTDDGLREIAVRGLKMDPLDKQRVYTKNGFAAWKTAAVAAGCKVKAVTRSKHNTYYQAIRQGVLLGFFNTGANGGGGRLGNTVRQWGHAE